MMCVWYVGMYAWSCMVCVSDVWACVICVVFVWYDMYGVSDVCGVCGVCDVGVVCAVWGWLCMVCMVSVYVWGCVRGTCVCGHEWCVWGVMCVMCVSDVPGVCGVCVLCRGRDVDVPAENQPQRPSFCEAPSLLPGQAVDSRPRVLSLHPAPASYKEGAQ